MRIIAKFEKRDAVRFISHLDVQRLFQRAMRRAGVPMAYSNGFNPHPQLAFATALSLGYTSSAEWLDCRLEADMSAAAFMAGLNETLPDGFSIMEAHDVDIALPTLATQLVSADYTVRFLGEVELSRLQNALDTLLSGQIIVDKRTKSGIKPVDLRPMINSMAVAGGGAEIKISGRLDAEGGLSVDLLLNELVREADYTGEYRVNRDLLHFAPQGEAAPFGI